MLQKVEENSDRIFRNKPTQFKREVFSFLLECGINQSLDICPDRYSKVAKHRSLKSSLYKHVQKNVLLKGSMTSAKRPRVILELYWCVEDWSGSLSLRPRFFDGMDVETDRDGWKFRVRRHMEIMEEVAEFRQSDNPKCPKCNGLMIEKQMKSVKESTKMTEEEKVGPFKLVRYKEIRHPHYGEWFWGCLRFPECRGMRAYWISPDQDKDVGNIVKDVSCPECGSPMVVRQARRGPRAGSKFLGCVSYPVCKGTLSKEKALALVLMQGDR